VVEKSTPRIYVFIITEMKNQKNLKIRLSKYFNRYIRLKECLETTGSTTSGFCFTCNAHKPFGELDAGHFMAGKNNSVKFIEENVHIQCKRCNYFERGNLIPYTLRMIEKYGQEKVNELQKIKKQAQKFTDSELEELIKIYKLKVKEYENN